MAVLRFTGQSSVPPVQQTSARGTKYLWSPSVHACAKTTVTVKGSKSSTRINASVSVQLKLPIIAAKDRSWTPNPASVFVQ